MLILKSNRHGFTMVEVMVAFAILIFGMMAILSATSAAIKFDVENLFRDEAVQIGDEMMRVVKTNNSATASDPFKNISTTTTRKSRLRGKGNVYTTTLTSTPTGGSSNLLTVLVSWELKGVQKRHEFSTLRTY